MRGPHLTLDHGPGIKMRTPHSNEHDMHSPKGSSGHDCCAGSPAREPVPKERVERSEVAYTCPMHPEVRQRGPGNCPICGMALEPLMPGATEDDSETKAIRRKFWIAFAL